jgi:1-acyl-sn-glycerol-3-phosphate acyltransferase
VVDRGRQTAGRFARALGGLFLRWFGWRVEGSLPPGVKGVAIAAPHTSNWDMPFMLAVAFVLGVRPAWLGKQELFRWPIGGLMRWLGGIPVDRTRRQRLVEQTATRFAESDGLFLVVPPSGTRSRAAHWKSGFYHIARGAGVPIICSFLDYRRKVGGIGLSFVPTGDVCADMDKIRAFYGTVTARFPDQVTPMRIREEDEPEPIAVGER